MEKCLVLWSGGLDSTVLMYYIKNEFGYEPIPIHFIYKSKQQEAQFEATSLMRGIHKHDPIDINIDLSFLSNNSLTGNKKVPDGEFNEDTIKDTTIPFRNGVMLSYAASLAESMDIGFIAIGIREVTHGSTYPDCSDDFVHSMYNSIGIGTTNDVSLLVPFMYYSMNKVDIVRYAIEYGIDLSYTYSCYNGNIPPCGTCPTCLDRIDAFKKNGIKDPALCINF